MALMSDHQDEINFWPVYSDLAMVMVLLLLLFIMTQFVVNSQHAVEEAKQLVEGQAQHEERSAEINRLKGSIFTLEEQLYKKAQARKKLEERQEAIAKLFSAQPGVRPVQPDGNIQLFVFNADVLFRPDDASLSPAGEMLMRSFGEVLRDQASYYTRIEIEGHADEQASRRFQREGDVSEDHGNWRLSAERAITVAQLLQRLGLSGEHLAVIGRSFYEPVNSRKAWEENRRIQVRLFYSEVLP